jgi:hypothetical protein
MNRHKKDTDTTVWSIGTTAFPTPQQIRFDYLASGWGHGYGMDGTTLLDDEVR